MSNTMRGVYKEYAAKRRIRVYHNSKPLTSFNAKLELAKSLLADHECQKRHEYVPISAACCSVSTLTICAIDNASIYEFIERNCL
jgi:hypothetical protein